MSVIGPPLLPDELEANGRVKIRSGSDEATRRALRLIGSGIAVGIVDDSINEEVEVTLSFAADMATQAELDAHAGQDNSHAYVLESLLDAKGDLYAASAADTPAKVTVGGNNSTLVAASAETAGVKWATAPIPHASSNRLQFTGTRTTTSSSFAAITTDTVQLVDFVKHRADTKLIATIGMALYSTTAVSSVELAAQIDGTDHVVVRRQLNAAASVVETAQGDSDDITGLAAGTYTITLRWRRVSGTGTVTTDATQQASLKVVETL